MGEGLFVKEDGHEKHLGKRIRKFQLTGLTTALPPASPRRLPAPPKGRICVDRIQYGCSKSLKARHLKRKKNFEENTSSCLVSCASALLLLSRLKKQAHDRRSAVCIILVNRRRRGFLLLLGSDRGFSRFERPNTTTAVWWVQKEAGLIGYAPPSL